MKPKSIPAPLEGDAQPVADTGSALEKPESPVVRKTVKKNLVRPVLRPATFRLPLDTHALIAAEIAFQAEQGNRLSQADVVTSALRHTYGRKHARRIRDRDA
jgi:hypothetical protein